MKLLVDQNLSPRLVDELAARSPGSAHVREFAMQRADDPTIWSFALEGGYAVVSKDWDFRHLSLLRGHPPKVVWVRLGNCSTDQILELLRRRAKDLERFFADAEASILELS